MKTLQRKLTVLLLIAFVNTLTYAQNLTVPNVSQKSIITQRLGLSDVTITYHSPGTQGRKVFGGIVPYGNIWRAGANENTTIHFTHDATIEGEKIPAGTYGLFIIPNEDSAIIQFSKYNKSWGTVSPIEEDLVITITVEPEVIAFQEWLSYDFTNRGSNSLTATLQWEKTRIPFNIEFDVVNVVIENFRHELKGLAGFGWQGHMQAASYCLQNDTNLEEAMVWIEKSLASASGFSNLMVKAGLLAKAGKTEESEKIIVDAIPTGTANQLNNYGYQLLGQNKTKEAIKVFALNVEKNQDDSFIWGFTDSLAEAYLKDGDKMNALKYYKIAKSKAPQNQQAYFDGVISGIK